MKNRKQEQSKEKTNKRFISFTRGIARRNRKVCVHSSENCHLYTRKKYIFYNGRELDVNANVVRKQKVIKEKGYLLKQRELICSSD